MTFIDNSYIILYHFFVRMICVGKVRLVQWAILWILLLLKTNVQHECSQMGACYGSHQETGFHPFGQTVYSRIRSDFIPSHKALGGRIFGQTALPYLWAPMVCYKVGLCIRHGNCLWIYPVLLATPCEGRLHRFSFGFLLLFVGLVGLTSAFYWGMFYPVLAPESGTITLLHVLSGVALFNVFFRKRGIPLEDGSISKVWKSPSFLAAGYFHIGIAVDSHCYWNDPTYFFNNPFYLGSGPF